MLVGIGIGIGIGIVPASYAAAALFPHNNKNWNWNCNCNCFPSKLQLQFQYSLSRLNSNSNSNCHWRRRCCGSYSSSSEEEEGRMAISSYISEMGLSKEESESIALNSPEYLKMLMEGVRDLESINGLGFNFNSSNLNYREKIIHIASLKGDNGKFAYLESIGFTLCSSMNVSRYIDKNLTLPFLINKLNSIKQLLFPPIDIDYDDSFINNILRFMRYLSIPIDDDDLQHTLSFFHKLQAKPKGLHILVHSQHQHLAFICFIQSFPRILSSSSNSSSFNNHIHFLHNIIGIPTQRIPNLILSFPPILLWNIQLLQTRLGAFNQLMIIMNNDHKEEDYANLLLKYPWLLSTTIQNNYKDLLIFFNSINLSNTCIYRAIKRQPQLLAYSTTNLNLMVNHFLQLGLPTNKLNQVISKSPQLLLLNPQHFLQVVLFFENMGFHKENIGRILARCPEVFATSISKTLHRKIEFLSRIGVSKAYFPVVIKKYPELLVSDIDKTLPQRIVYLMKLGLSEKEIAFMVRKFSPLLGYSIKEVLRPKIEFLVNSMKRPVRDVVGYPRYFSYSLETKIKPRYWVLKGKNIECSLKDMLGKNDEEFAADFMGVGRMFTSPPLSSHDRL